MHPQPRRFLSRFVIALSLLLGITAPLGQAQSTAKIQVVADLIKLLPQARAQHATEVSLRSSGRSGDVEKPAIYHHPTHTPPTTTLQYQLTLPKTAKDERLFLVFGIGLADGAKLGQTQDGVTYSITANGKPLFRRQWKKTAWEMHAIELAEFSNQPLTLTLAVDSGKNSSYDWAMWAEPAVLRFTPTDEPPPDGEPISGIILTRRPPGEANNPAWLPLSFDSAKSLSIISPADQAIIGHFGPEIVIEQLATERIIAHAGDTVPLAVKVTNNGLGHLTDDKWPVTLSVNGKKLKPKTISRLSPGQKTVLRWNWNSPNTPATHDLAAYLAGSKQRETEFKTYPKKSNGKIVTIENDQLRLEFVPIKNRYEYAKIYGRDGDSWYQMAIWHPLAEIADSTDTIRVMPNQINFNENNNRQFASFTHTTKQNGNEWTTQVEIVLPKNGDPMRVHHQFSATKKTTLIRATGPNLHIGDGTSGRAKSWGLFPGLEYLNGPEPSSNIRDLAPPKNDRSTPHPNKITIPFMTITLGQNSKLPPNKPDFYFTPDSIESRNQLQHPNLSLLPNNQLSLSLAWNPLQKWDGIHTLPTAHFSSPNDTELVASHRMALSIPSVPEFASEHPGRPVEPYIVSPGRPLSIKSNIKLTQGTPLKALRAWLDDNGGIPKPNPAPRSFMDELALCRTGFLDTVRGDSEGRFRHCIGWGSSHSAGFSMLLWLDGLVSGSQKARSAATLAASQMLQEGGPDRLTSHNLTHIVRWELPFHFGHLAEAMEALDERIDRLAKSQHSDGGWRQPALSGKHAKLGKAGDAVSGTVARQTMELMRHARITGDTDSLTAGFKALEFLNNFSLPRGAQMWECPMYQPDILAAGYAVAANLDAWRCTGNEAHLRESIRWAETGVPFIYLWSLPDKPMMLGATIPVFGSTFFTHSWLGVPVQWCGLVYSYHVWHLQEELAKRPDLAKRLARRTELRFTPADWKRMVQLITYSAMHQQFADGEKIGTYPDSIVDFEKRMPAFINPEDILANVLLLNGHDPDIKTIRISQPNQTVTLSSVAKLTRHRSDKDVSIDFEYYPGEPVHFLIAGLVPSEVLVNGSTLSRSEKPPGREPGWWRDPDSHRVYITTPAQKDKATLILQP